MGITKKLDSNYFELLEGLRITIPKDKENRSLNSYRRNL